MLSDFQLLPQVVDMQTFVRLFRVVKLWEWQIAECAAEALYGGKAVTGGAGGSAVTSPTSASSPFMMRDDSMSVDVRSLALGSHASSGTDSPLDPLDFRASVGHHSLTLP